MAKQIISSAIENELLERLDAVAEKRGETRSAVVERMLRNTIDEEEEFIGDMESSFWRNMMKGLIKSPLAAKALAAVAREQLTPQQYERFQKEMPKQIQLGMERQKKKVASRGRKKK